MKSRRSCWVLVLALSGCASIQDDTKIVTQTAPAPSPEKVNWTEVDRSAARSKEEAKKSTGAGTTTVTEKVERGYFPMTDAEYAAALASAIDDVRKTNPKWADAAVEEEAIRRADEAKRKYENSYQARASTSVEWSITTHSSP